jgi:hypothetical protein
LRDTPGTNNIVIVSWFIYIKNRNDTVCQWATGFTDTDGILAPEFCACYSISTIDVLVKAVFVLFHTAMC